jgi:glycosyltransferase involved in cell wall biosynthesis
LSRNPIRPRRPRTREQAGLPIRVLHVVDKLSTGGSPVHGLTRLLSWWLPLHDPGRVRASVACLRGPDEGEAALEKAGVNVNYLGRMKYDAGTVPRLVRAVRAEQIDILHLHGYGGSTIGRICGWITGLPCIVHEHICDAAIPASQRLADRVLRSRTAAAIAVSKPVADFLVEKRFISARDVRIVHSGVPLELFRQPPTGRWHRALGLPDGHQLVATVGRLHASKGLAYFLKAARQVLDAVENVTFLIVGDGDLHDELRRQAQKLGLWDNVIFTGHIDDVPSLLADVDVFAISSVTEGGPITLFEAMAAGRAIVATSVGAVPEVLEDSASGFVVPPGDADALAAKCILLLENRALVEDLGARAREEAHRYEASEAVDAFELLYDRVVEGRA